MRNRLTSMRRPSRRSMAILVMLAALVCLSSLPTTMGAVNPPAVALRKVERQLQTDGTVATTAPPTEAPTGEPTSRPPRFFTPNAGGTTNSSRRNSTFVPGGAVVVGKTNFTRPGYSMETGESTFLGYFKTEKIYLMFCIAAPGVFIVFKMILWIYFCRNGVDKKDDEFANTDDDSVVLDEDERAVSVAGGMQKSVLGDAGSSYQHAAPRNHGGNKSANFWIEEELQAWRLDFQQLKMMKSLTPTPSQRRHVGRVNSGIGAAGAGPAVSEVWLGTYYAMDQDNNERLVALKWIPPHLKHVESQQDKLKEEVKRQARLRHPNVAAFIGVAWSPETHLIVVTEYMSRGDLRQWLHHNAREAGKWSVTKVRMILDVANALLYLHSFQPRFVHGNCNSRNVLLNDKMQAKLSDFGAPKDHLTEREIQAYNQVGSGRWISPEALVSRESRSESMSDAMDVYSFGILMVEMDTHELPFADLMHADRSQLPENDVLQLIAKGALSPTLSQSCHPQIAKLVRACTAYAPQQRPSSREIVRQLQQLVQQMSSESVEKR